MIRYRLLACLGLVAFAASAVAGKETTRESSTPESLRRFTLRQAIETAFQRNPDILRARQEIRRTKGIEIQVLSQAVPQLTADAVFTRTDSELTNNGRSGGGSAPTPTIAPSPTPAGTPGSSCRCRPSARIL